MVILPDIGYGATQGDTVEEALHQAEDMLEEAILGMIANNRRSAPLACAGRPAVRLPAVTAVKLELYYAMREAGLDAAQLAQRLGWPPKKIAHIFDGYHAVRLEQLEAALAALGRRLVVASNRDSEPPSLCNAKWLTEVPGTKIGTSPIYELQVKFSKMPRIPAS